MVVTQTASRKVQYKGIENRVLRNMTDDQLVEEQLRVERDLAQWNRAVLSLPFEQRKEPHLLKEKRCLRSERNRIYEERARRILGIAVEEVA